MPWLTFVVSRLFGVAGQCHHRPSGMFRRYAWPSARWGSMHIEGGVSAAYRRVIEAADDPAAKRAEIERQLEDLASPFLTAEATAQDIILRNVLPDGDLEILRRQSDRVMRRRTMKKREQKGGGIFDSKSGLTKVMGQPQIESVHRCSRPRRIVTGVSTGI